MKILNAIIIDDEKLGRDTISGIVKEFCSNVRIVAECDNITSAKESIEELHPDFIFLDIAMPGGSGFDLLKTIDKIDFDIIFVTAHNEYAINALKFNAVDYLLKPIDEDELLVAIGRVSEQRNSNFEKLNIKNLISSYLSNSFKKIDNLCLPTSLGFQIIKLDDIICCEASNTYTIFYLLDNIQIVSTKPLVEYDSILSDSGFMRIHKSWLVNIKHVKEYRRGEGGTVILTGNKQVDVSRRKKEYFVSELKKVFKF